MNLREHVRKVQLLENKAADKAGARFQLLDEPQLMGSKYKRYVQGYIKSLEADIAKEVLQSARLGKELFNVVTK